MSAGVIQLPVFPDDVDVAIVSHNSLDTLPRVIDCLHSAGAMDRRITIYDIASSDETGRWLASSHPDVTVRRLDENVGPNPARNWALRDATRPYLLLLDSDAFLRPDAPALLRAAIEPNSRVGTVTPVVVHGQRPDVIQYAGVDLHFICEAVNPWQDRPLAERGDDRHDIGSAAGVALLIDVAVAREIGLWDERYFMGKDDGDFCYRLRLAGYRLVEEPRAIVEHGSKPRSTWMFPFQIRNRWYFLLKNYRARTLLVLAPVLCVHEVLQFVMLIGKGHFGAWWKAMRAIVGWLPGIRVSRRAVQATRTVRDRDLLVAAPLLVRPDLVGGGVGRSLKRAYDAWLSAYWGLARHLVS
jgi:GT2 family glycosyltransferase